MEPSGLSKAGTNVEVKLLEILLARCQESREVRIGRILTSSIGENF